MQVSMGIVVTQPPKRGFLAETQSTTATTTPDRMDLAAIDIQFISWRR
jgi:hypothetical protein